jgi:hypothetical protein
VKRAQAEWEALKSDPLKLLKHSGHDYEKLTRDILAGKYVPETPEQVALGKQASEVEQVKAELNAIKQERETLREQQVRMQEVTHVTNTIAQHAEQFPALATVKWAPEKVRELYYARAQETGQTPDLGAILTEFENAVSNDVTAVLSDERAVKKLLADPAIKSLVVKALGLTAERAAASPASDPKGVTGAREVRAITQDIAAEAGDRAHKPRNLTVSERKKAAVAALSAALGKAS